MRWVEEHPRWSARASSTARSGAEPRSGERCRARGVSPGYMAAIREESPGGVTDRGSGASRSGRGSVFVAPSGLVFSHSTTLHSSGRTRNFSVKKGAGSWPTPAISLGCCRGGCSPTHAGPSRRRPPARSSRAPASTHRFASRTHGSISRASARSRHRSLWRRRLNCR